MAEMASLHIKIQRIIQLSESYRLFCKFYSRQIDNLIFIMYNLRYI